MDLQSPGRAGLPFAALALLALVAGGATGADVPAVAGLAVLVGGSAGRNLGGLVVAIAVGAVVLGAAAAAVVAVANASVPISLAAGLGVAVGGGLGSTVWLLAVGGEEPDEGEAVTVDMGDTSPSPEPEPADLFEASPDPILYVGGQERVVRAANPAFGDVFDVDPTTVKAVPLEDALEGIVNAAGIIDAVEAGRPLDKTVTVEADVSQESIRVRVVPTGGVHWATYVVFGPV